MQSSSTRLRCVKSISARLSRFRPWSHRCGSAPGHFEHIPPMHDLSSPSKSSLTSLDDRHSTPLAVVNPTLISHRGDAKPRAPAYRRNHGGSVSVIYGTAQGRRCSEPCRCIQNVDWSQSLVYRSPVHTTGLKRPSFPPLRSPSASDISPT